MDMRMRKPSHRRLYLLLLTLISLGRLLEAFSVRRKSTLSKVKANNGWVSVLDFAVSRGGSSLSALEDDKDKETAGSLTTTTTTTTKDNEAVGAIALQQQAAALRAEIELIEKGLEESREAKRQKELADIDKWIEECLYVVVPSSNNNNVNDENDDEEEDTSTSSAASGVELLNSVETAAQILRDNRYSHEQVSKMFERICDTSPAQSRSNCSPLLALLVDAAGKLDCVDRDVNPNKRWSGKVERDLRKRLFAMDWGIELEIDNTGNDRFI